MSLLKTSTVPEEEKSGRKERYANFLVTINTNYSPRSWVLNQQEIEEFEDRFGDVISYIFGDHLEDIILFPKDPDATFNTHIDQDALQVDMAIEESSRRTGHRTHAHIIVQITHYAKMVKLDIDAIRDIVASSLEEVNKPYV